MLLEAKNISFRYKNGPWLFKNISLNISQGEIVGLQGPSGMGKTTLCRILSGYEKPLEGNISLDGKPPVKKGYNPVQHIFQHPEQAVNTRWQMKKIVNEAWTPDRDTLASFGIEEEWLNRWPNELSGGELQRFCVVRAVGPKTKFLIADEMTTMLDAITQAQIWQALLAIAEKRNLGIIVVSHEEQLLKRLCTRVIDLSTLIEQSY